MNEEWYTNDTLYFRGLHQWCVVVGKKRDIFDCERTSWYQEEGQDVIFQSLKYSN